MRTLTIRPRPIATTVLLLTLLPLTQALAGPLDPPAGPIAPTHKTLSEVEPRTAVNAANTPGIGTNLFKITQPGSYYLTGDIQGVPSKCGIEIAADGVSLDLNGFDLVGVPGSLDGVRVTKIGADNVAISNGGVRLWGEDGIDAAFPGSAIGATITAIRAYSNGFSGIRASSNVVITRCTAYANFDHGITATQAATIIDCCVSENTGDGIRAGEGSTIVSCTSYDNDSIGVRCFPDCTVTACTSIRNSTGIDAGGTISNCTAAKSTFNGISARADTAVSACTARDNGNNGIIAAERCTITGCTVSLSTFNGILATSNCRITDNNCTSNASFNAGIRVNGARNHIEGNTCTSNGRGIDARVAGNFIARNTLSGNTTNILLSGTQTIGPIVTLTGTITEPSPWANFVY
jgi:parallel beta-helix repeat protein